MGQSGVKMQTSQHEEFASENKHLRAARLQPLAGSHHNKSPSWSVNRVADAGKWRAGQGSVICLSVAKTATVTLLGIPQGSKPKDLDAGLIHLLFLKSYFTHQIILNPLWLCSDGNRTMYSSCLACSMTDPFPLWQRGLGLRSFYGDRKHFWLSQLPSHPDHLSDWPQIPTNLSLLLDA